MTPARVRFMLTAKSNANSNSRIPGPLCTAIVLAGSLFRSGCVLGFDFAVDVCMQICVHMHTLSACICMHAPKQSDTCDQRAHTTRKYTHQHGPTLYARTHVNASRFPERAR
eukprot:2437915-Rhodomonas_salina.1